MSFGSFVAGMGCFVGVHADAFLEAHDSKLDVAEAGALNTTGCVGLDSGFAFHNNDVNNWPCVKVERGASTWTNIPRLPNMLDKTLKVTVDLSDVGCRNVLAFQMVDSAHNGGNYCDGQYDDPCVEIDFLEANEHVWGTNIHAGGMPGGWKNGIAKGYGGDRSGMWNYGVDGGNVNTKYPIDVNYNFPTDSDGNLMYIRVTMYQFGNTQPKAEFRLGEGQTEGLKQTTWALRAGMAPGFSYWDTEGMGSGGVSWYDKDQCNYFYPGAPAYFSQWQLLDGWGTANV